MTTPMTELPRIRAFVRGDGTGEVTIDGVSEPVTAADDEGVREEIIGLVTDAARGLNRPVFLLSEDEQGQWPLTVHPDGRVEAAGDFIPAAIAPMGAHSSEPATTDAPAASAPKSAARISNTPVLATPVSAASALAAAPSVTPAPGATAPAAPARATSESAAPGPRRDALSEAFPDAVPEEDDDPEDLPTTRPAGGVDTFTGVLAGLIPPLPTTPPRAVRSSPPSVVPTGVPFTATAVVAAVAPTAAPAAPPTPAAQPQATGGQPNLADFLSSRPPVPAGPAQQGWQGTVRRLTGGLVSFAPGGVELAERNAISAVQRSFNGPRTIVVLNPKGGAHKTTATLLIAATFGIYRGGYTLAWDNNETMGTLGVRAQAARHTNTAVDLLRDLDHFGDAGARVGDLDNYVRNQGDAQFDALASDLDPAGAASIDDVAFRRLHANLSRFYRVLVIDTGNNMRASNWEAAVETADQLVVVSTIREDTGYGAASLLDGLRQKGHAQKVAEAVTILASPSKTADEHLSQRLHDHFQKLTRTVVDVPFDASLVGGGPLIVEALAPRTRAAWLRATAEIAEGL